MSTPALMGGFVTGMAANTPHAIPIGPYRLLTNGVVTFATTVGGSYSTLSGANAEPGVLVSGGFIQGAAPRVVVLKKINSISSSYAALVGKSNPAYYYRLGEQTGTVLYDSVGANNLTKGSTVVLGTTGPLGDGNFAITLDGTVNSVSTLAAANAWSGASALSFEAWINNAAFGAGHEVVLSLGGQGIYMSFNGGKLIMSIFLVGQHTSLALTTTTGNAWHHIATTWASGDIIRLYVDGAAVTGDDLTVRTGTITSGSANINLGAFNGTSLFYSGIMDEVAIYTRKLTASEVKSHFSARLVKS